VREFVERRGIDCPDVDQDLPEAATIGLLTLQGSLYLVGRDKLRRDQ
jgi:hypothetical protein